MDYSQYNITDDPPSPHKKKRKVDLKRRPSAKRLAAEKYKTKPLNLPHPVRNPVMMSIVTPPTKASTSSTKGIVMKPVTQMETDELLNQMLDIDAPQEDNEKGEYDVPIVPNLTPVQPAGRVPKTNTDAQVTTKNTEDNNSKPLLLPRMLGTAVKIETPANNEKSKPKLKVFKTVEYKLKRKYSKPRKFSCVNCVEKLETQKELNDHFRTAHLPVKCDLCQEFFDTPACYATA